MLTDSYRLYIFDWDGTLSTSTSIVKFTRLVKRRYSVAQISSHKGSYNIEKLPRFKDEHTSRLYSIAYWLYSRIYKPRLKPGAIELLELLRENGKKIAVFSDSNRYRLAIEVKRLGVLDHVDFVLSADSIKKFKPNPTGLITIIDQFRLNKSDCIYIGDMAADVFTARFAGIDSCAVADGVDSYSLLKGMNPTYIARTLDSIKDVK